MKISPIAAPSAVQQPTSNNTDARAKAIAAFNQAAQPPVQVVQNQNQVSAEELTAIQAPETRQEDNNEEIQAVSAESAEPVAEAPAKVETPAEAAASRQFAQLARQEKALRAKVATQEAQFKAREAAISEREAAISRPQQPVADPKNYYTRDQIKQDALRILEESGVSYDEVTQQALQAHPTDPRVTRHLSALEQTVKDLQAKLDAQEKGQTESQTKAYDAAVEQISRDVANMVKTDDNFEMIRVTGSQKDVVELIKETFAKDGILMSNEEAANEVENYLVEEALKLANAKKVKQKLSTVAPKTASSTATQTPPQAPKQPQPMKTLTNATASTRTLSAKERAILAFKGELKS